MISRPSGPFHSLSDADNEGLRDLLSQGVSLRQAAIRLGCNYGHAVYSAHSEELIKHRVRFNDEPLLLRAMELVRGGTSVFAASRELGISDTVLRLRAEKAGLVTPISQPQRRINNTNQRVIYLRLRLSSLSRNDAAAATGIDNRKALLF